MAEQTNREKNQAASQQQAQVREQEVTVRGGKFDGLTKRNEDYLFHLDKALDERGMDYEKKNDILETMYQELKKVQKQGYTATQNFWFWAGAASFLAGPSTNSLAFSWTGPYNLVAV